jgi:hypothetical protein|tara:strand:- start:262 stop:543 length:282 start_codon:yes stop_codon:yes gene_type:complete
MSIHSQLHLRVTAMTEEDVFGGACDILGTVAEVVANDVASGVLFMGTSDDPEVRVDFFLDRLSDIPLNFEDNDDANNYSFGKWLQSIRGDENV